MPAADRKSARRTGATTVPTVPTVPTVDVTRAADRIRAAEWALTSGSRRVDLIAEIGSLQADLARRRAELAADEGLLARKWMELEAIEKGAAAKADAFGPPKAPTLTLKEVCGLLGCTEATAKKLAERHGFGWCRDGRWRFSRAEVVAYVSGLPTDPM